MRVCVSTEQRFEKTPDGKVWVSGGPSYTFWQRYLDVFEKVQVIARIRDAAEPGAGTRRADGEHVWFCGVPYYIGPCQYAWHAAAIRSAIHRGVARSDAVILRAPSPMTWLFRPLLRCGRPFALEVVGDPADVLARGAAQHWLTPLLRPWATAQLRGQCRDACAVAFVTESALQKRYAAGAGAFSTHYSSIELPDEAFAAAARHYSGSQSVCRMITVASLEQPYKGVDVLIDAMRICVAEGLSIHLAVVGDGRFRLELERQTAVYGLQDAVRFLGALPAGAPVRARLDGADLFVLASKTEGLPRAMIEAMARALPCLGSNVGGIPELLPPEDMTPRGDAPALARKIREVWTDPVRMTRMSRANLSRAWGYDDRTLRARRREFLRYVQSATESWLNCETSRTPLLYSTSASNRT